MLYEDSKEGIALLEDDLKERGVIAVPPSDRPMPKKVVGVFMREDLERFAEARGCEVVATWSSYTADLPLYRLPDEDVGLTAFPVGASQAAVMLDILYQRGVELVLAVGSCGTLIDLPEGEIVVPDVVVRDEGTSFHYAPPSRTLRMDSDMVEALCAFFDARRQPAMRHKTWTTDGFLRETPSRIRRRRAEGCAVVDMECSAMIAVAQFYGRAFAQFFFTADSLADPDRHDVRNFGKDAHARVIELAVEAARFLEVQK